MVTQLNESDPAIHRWVALSRWLMYGLPIADIIGSGILENSCGLKPGWNAVMNSSGNISRYIFNGDQQGITRFDPPPVDESEIYRVPYDETGLKFVFVLHMYLTQVLVKRSDLDDSSRTAIRNAADTIRDFIEMPDEQAIRFATQPIQQVEEEFLHQFINTDEMRITGGLAWRTVKEAHNTFRDYLNFQIPGFVAALRLMAIHGIHCRALAQWSSENRVVEYFDKNLDHLQKRAFILLDQSKDATLESAGHMIYLAHLYGLTALMMGSKKVYAEDDPEELSSEALYYPKCFIKDPKSKAIDELLAHRVVPAFYGPALLMPYSGMLEAEQRCYAQPFIYPQLKERVSTKELRQLSQQQLFDHVHEYNGGLNKVDVMNSVIKGDNQPIELGSLKVFSVQQQGRNLLHFLLDKTKKREEEHPRDDGDGGNTAT